MNTEERQECDRQATQVFLVIIWSGLFITAGAKWLDRNLLDLPFRNLAYLLIVVTAVFSAMGLVKLASHLKALKKA